MILDEYTAFQDPTGIELTYAEKNPTDPAGSQTQAWVSLLYTYMFR